jgi:hypothetical protein
MKIKGRVVKGLNTAVAVIPRPDGNLVFKAVAISNYDEFDAIVKEPVAPIMTMAGGLQVSDFKDAQYLRKQTEYNLLRNNWMAIKSLSATEGLEWEKVDLLKPETYGLWQDELKDADLIPSEINCVIGAIIEANNLSAEKLDKARESFLAEERSKEQS